MLTEEQITALASDAGALQRGRALAFPEKWQTLGLADNALWGLCKGSGAVPYRCAVDLEQKGFFCTCRTFTSPCKHALGLMFLHLNNRNCWEQSAVIPAEVELWLGKRRNGNRPAAAPEKKPKTPLDAAALQRAQEREAEIEAALDTFLMWLSDNVRRGLAQLPLTDAAFWEQPAARLADAKLRPLRNALKQTALELQNPNIDASELLLRRMGEWYALVRAFGNRHRLPEDLRQDLLDALGRVVRKQDVLDGGQRQADLWQVVGMEQGENLDGVPFRKVWLLGTGSRRFALLLDYRFGDANFEHFFAPNMCLRAELAFYPSAYPLRAVVHTLTEAQSQAPDLAAGYADFEGLQTAHAQALGRQPWLEGFPAFLLGVLPLRQAGKFYLMDRKGSLLRLPSEPSSAFWQIVAQSAGLGIDLFGILDSGRFQPLSLATEQGWKAVNAQGTLP